MPKRVRRLNRGSQRFRSLPHRSKKVTNHPVVNRELTIDELKAALSKEKEKNRLLHIELRCVSSAGGPASAPGLARICAGTRPHLRRTCAPAGAYKRRLIQTLEADMIGAVCRSMEQGTLSESQVCGHGWRHAQGREWKPGNPRVSRNGPR